MLVLVPFVRGLCVVVRASRSADSTSVMLSYVSVIAQTRERNCCADSIVPIVRGIERLFSSSACDALLLADLGLEGLSEIPCSILFF